MGYQIGVSGLAGFHHMLSTIIDENWEEAAAQMLDSTLAKQTPERASRHAAVMACGHQPSGCTGARGKDGTGGAVAPM